MPVATPTFGNGKRSDGREPEQRRVGEGVAAAADHARPARRARTRRGASTSWEPVPRRPTVSHVSRISTSAAGTRAKHSGRGRGPSTVAPTTISSATGPPVTKGQRPLSRQPPSDATGPAEGGAGAGDDDRGRGGAHDRMVSARDVAGGDLDLLVEGHDRPAGRAVDAGHRLDQLHERQAGGLLAAVVAGRQDAQQPGIGERPHDRRRRPARRPASRGRVRAPGRQASRPARRAARAHPDRPRSAPGPPHPAWAGPYCAVAGHPIRRASSVRPRAQSTSSTRGEPARPGQFQPLRASCDRPVGDRSAPAITAAPR